MGKQIIARELARKHKQGFTLVELLVVLVIALTVITVTTVAYGKLSANAYLKSSARHVAASLRYARSYAVAQGVDTTFAIDFNERSYQFTGNAQVFTFKNNIDLNVLTATAFNTRQDNAQIRFAPDGSSSGGRVELSSRNKKYIVYVDWLTGRTTVAHEKL